MRCARMEGMLKIEFNAAILEKGATCTFLDKFIFSVLTTNLISSYEYGTVERFDESVNKRKTLDHGPQDAAHKMDAENHSKKMPRM